MTLVSDRVAATLSDTVTPQGLVAVTRTAADTLDKVVPRELAENGAVMVVLAYAIANLPETLPR